MLIAQISDMHVKAEGELLYGRIDTAGFLERAVAHVNALDPRPDIVIATGDLVEGGKPEEYARLKRLLAPLAMPVHLIPGNHDARDALREVFADHAYLPRSARLAGGTARRKRPPDDPVHASSAVRLRHRRLRQCQAERGRRATGRHCSQI